MSPKKNSSKPGLPTRLPIVTIGYGKWGQALSQSFRDAGHQLEFLEGGLSEKAWKKKFENPKLVILATPFSAIEQILSRLQKTANLMGVVNGSKGIDRKNLKTFYALSKPLLRVPRASLSGPSFAKELMEKKPTAAIIASKDLSFAQELCHRLSTPYFRLYSHNDPIGVETCGAVKNILAIAAGMVDGLKLGHNARAALLCRGSLEMMKLVRKLGGQETSVFGLAGMGDLWLTATGDLSRNRRLGQLLSQGLSRQEASDQIGETVEGLYTLKQVETLRRNSKMDLPICEQVYKVCYQKLKVEKAVASLMTRAVKNEESSLWRLR